MLIDVAGVVISTSIAVWAGWLIGKNWRQSLTSHAHDLYFRNNLFYHVLTFDKEVSVLPP